MLLGDLGADVIRVEPPGGSPARRSEPRLHGGPNDRSSLSFLAFNRNKRSIVLDPKQQDDRDVLQALLARCDFFVHFYPGWCAGRIRY